MVERVRSIRVELDEKGAEDLELVRRHLGLRNDSEVFRYLLREKARELRRAENVTPVTAEVEG